MLFLASRVAEAAGEAGPLRQSRVRKLLSNGSDLTDVWELARQVPADKSGATKNNGVQNKFIEVIKIGTSTKEESDVISKYGKENQLSKVIVLSDKFHTNRIRSVFNKAFKNNSTQLLIHGSPSSQYDEDYWWKSEQGLIMVNNEYVKSLYYLIKY